MDSSPANLPDYEALKALVAERSATPILVTDASGLIRWVNPAFTTTTGFTLDEVAGKRPGAFLQGPETDPATVAHMREQLRAGRGFHVEIRNYHKGGSIVWLSLVVDPIHDAQGRLLGFVGVQTDISRRKAVEHSLEQARAVLAEAQRLARVGSWEWQMDGDMVTWSEELYDIFGRDRSLPAPSYAELPTTYEPESFARLAQAVQAAVTDGTPYRLSDLRLIRSDGTRRWGEATGAPVRNAEGRVVGLRGTLQDVTAWRDSEDARRRSEERARFALEGAGDGLWDWDVQTGTVDYSTRWKAMLGYAEHEVGSSIDDWASRVHPEDLARANEVLGAHLRGERANFAAEVRMLRKDGTWHWVMTRGTVVSRDADGTPRRMIGTHTDISAQKALEEELRTARDAAQAATRAKSDFLARMSHELRTPLNSIIGFSRQVARNREGTLSSRQVGYLDRVVANGTHLLRVIDEILDIAKVEAGRMHVELAPLELGALLDEVVSITEPLAKPGVRVSRDALPGPLVIRSDRPKLLQILLNLAGNACKFTETGDVRLTASVDADGGLRIEVADTGPGIPPDRVEAVFEAFEQADGSTQRRHGGTGLGLAICRSFAALLGGTVTLRSTLGEGATFTVSLPGAVVAAAPAAAEARPVAATAG